MKNFKLLFSLLTMAVIFGCNEGKSLQKYYVENQEDSDFMALDVPVNMFANVDSLDDEQKNTLKSIKKINVLALKAEQNPEKFISEKSKLKEILQDEKYQLLMKYGGGERKAELYFTGDEEAIDELIVYGFDNERGLGIARVLGDDMNPEKIIAMIKSMDKNDVNLKSLRQIGDMFEAELKKEENSKVMVQIGTESDSINKQEK